MLQGNREFPKHTLELYQINIYIDLKARMNETDASGPYFDVKSGVR